MSLKEVKPFYRDENGVLCINTHCTGANADPIRSARLAVKAKAGDKQAIKDLAELNASKVYEEVDD